MAQLNTNPESPNFLKLVGTSLEPVNSAWSINAGSIDIGDSVTSGTVGSVLFVDGSGDLGQDNDNLFWDDSNNRLGIGTKTPSDLVHILKSQNANTFLLADNQTNDTAAATGSKMNSADATGLFFVTPSSYTNVPIATKRFNIIASSATLGDNDTDGLNLVAAKSTGDVKIYTGGFTSSEERCIIDSSGNVGIGTSTPNEGLTLEGGVLSVLETTTPTPTTNYGKIYTKTDNELYFQDGAGSEKTVNTNGGDLLASNNLSDVDNAATSLSNIGGIGAATTDTLTNKTFDANGTGNSLSNVDIADLANGTDGELITWDAAGAPAAVATGTAAQVLTSNGAGAAPTFQSVAASGNKVAWLGAGELQSDGSFTAFTDSPAWALADGSALTVRSSWTVPSDFSSLTSVEIYWFTTAASGNAYLQFDSRGIASGESAGETDGIANATYATGGASVLDVTDVTAMANGLSFTAGDVINLKMIRRGNDANDTLGQIMYFVGYRIVYA